MYRKMLFFKKIHLWQLLCPFFITSLGCDTLKQTCQSTSLPNICQTLANLYQSNGIPFDIKNREVCSWDRVTCNDKNQIIGLSFHGKNIKSLPSEIFANLSHLQVLSLGNNHLSNLPNGIFSNLSQLEKLNLGGNRLTSLPSEIFSNLPQLQVLNLSENQLSSLPKGIFATLSQLRDLNLLGNPFPASFKLDQSICKQVQVIPVTLCN